MRKFVSTLLVIPAFVLIAGCSEAEVPQTEGTEVTVKEEVAFSGEYTEMDQTQSTLTFVGGSTIIDHEGSFKTFDVTLTPDTTNPADLENASLEVRVDVSSVQTDSEGLDGHLMAEEFFDVENYPEVTFTSTDIRAEGDNRYSIVGDLTVKGMTKSVTLDASVTDTGMTVVFDLPRKEFAIGNDSYGDKLLDDIVPVNAEIVFES